jgi:hypothetical protein
MAIIPKLHRVVIVFPTQLSDSSILVSWPCPEAHSAQFSTIQTHLSHRSCLAVDSLTFGEGLREQTLSYLSSTKCRKCPLSTETGDRLIRIGSDPCQVNLVRCLVTLRRSCCVRQSPSSAATSSGGCNPTHVAALSARILSVVSTRHLRRDVRFRAYFVCFTPDFGHS